MKKDAYYFPHFSNARHDRKLRRVRKELGVEGYGIYFMVLETLRDQENFSFPVADIDLLAEDFGTSEQKIRTVVANYGLFTFTEDGEMFTSERFIEYMRPYIEKKERARAAARARWGGDANAYANALPEQFDSNASKVKKSKVNETKVDKSKTLIDGYPVTESTHNQLVSTYTLPTVIDYYQRISNYVSSKGKKDYKDYAATAWNWIKRDIESGRYSPPKPRQHSEPDEVEIALQKNMKKQEESEDGRD